MHLRPALSAFILLATLATPSAAAASPPAGFAAATVAGNGPFALGLAGGTWVAQPPPTPDWHLEATALHIRVVDDQESPRVVSPFNGSNDLYANRHRFPNDYFYAASGLDIVRNEGDALVLGLGAAAPITVGARGPFTVAPSDAAELEHWHDHSSGAVGDLADSYSYGHPAGPAATLTLADLPTNGTRLYVWGANLTVRDADGGFTTYRTGTWVDPQPEAAMPAVPDAGLPRPPPASGVRHYAFALVDLTGAGPIPAQHATAYATSLTLRGDGDLLFRDAHGTLDDRAGTLAVDGDVRVAGGTFRLALDGTRLRATPASGLDGFTGAVAYHAHPFPWLPWTLAAAAVAAALYAWPALRGWLLVRSSTPRVPRHLRSEAYAHWASRAQVHDWVRLALWLEGRAVHNAPTVGDFRTERAILLRQAGRPDAALAEHRRAHDLLALGPDGGYLALNAFQAALAGAEAGRDAEAVLWMQTALEADRGLIQELQAHPTLRRLASHPDYGAVTT